MQAAGQLMFGQGQQIGGNVFPFRAVATDLLSGAMLDQADTPLFEALLQSLFLRTIFLRIRQEGKSEEVMAVNIAREDFEKVVTAMRERGSAVNAAYRQSI